jgi:carbonic anhydrase/acetyltransferase-like protein (isoleucine patch superfamily)
VQDGVVLHGLETMEEGKQEKNRVSWRQIFCLYRRKGLMAHQSQVRSALVGSDSFIGMQALVFKATGVMVLY